MPSRLKNFKNWAIYLLIALLSLQIGARMNVCLMPDGDVHPKQDHAPCDLSDSQSTAVSSLLDGHHLDGQDHLDITIEEGALARHQKSAVHYPTPVAISVTSAVTLPQPEVPSLRHPKFDISPQLLPLRSIDILRI